MPEFPFKKEGRRSGRFFRQTTIPFSNGSHKLCRRLRPVPYGCRCRIIELLTGNGSQFDSQPAFPVRREFPECPRAFRRVA